jgi:hypothetical protein
MDKSIYSRIKGCDTIYEEGSETINSMVILAVFLGAAFVVSAVLPAELTTSEEFKPLEVVKNKLSGPAVVVMDNQALWDLQITVTNNLDSNLEKVEDDVVDDMDDTTTLFIPSMKTRSDGEAISTQILDKSTISDVVVTDVLPSEFSLLEFTPSFGDVIINYDSLGATLITWNVGNLAPETSATLDLAVVSSGFSKPGTYVLNSGASVSGILYSTKEILTDGPTEAIFITVIDGTPNEGPIAEAGVDQMAFEDDPIYLEGSGSYDPDGTVIRYTWFVGNKHVGSSKSVLTYYFPVGEHEVTLFVEDNRGAVDSDSVTITIYKEDAQIPGAIMYGTVRDATTRQGFDPYIQVWNEHYAISTWTDMGGNYRIIGLPAGHYQTYCESKGYSDFYGEITITDNAEILYDIDMIRE